MPIDDIKTLKRKIESVTLNLRIYQKDLDKYLSKLKNEFGIDRFDDIEGEAERLDKQIKELIEEKSKLLSKANNILKDVSDEY